MEVKQLQCDECGKIETLGVNNLGSWIEIYRMEMEVITRNLVPWLQGNIGTCDNISKHFCSKECARQYVKNYLQNMLDNVILNAFIDKTMGGLKC